MPFQDTLHISLKEKRAFNSHNVKFISDNYNCVMSEIESQKPVFLPLCHILLNYEHILDDKLTIEVHIQVTPKIGCWATISRQNSFTASWHKFFKCLEV